MIHAIPIKGTSKTLSIDDSEEGGLPVEIYTKALYFGFKYLLDAAQTKLGSRNKYTGTDAQYETDAVKNAEAEYANWKNGKTTRRMAGAKKAAKGAEAVLHAEMLRVATAYVKNLTKQQNDLTDDPKQKVRLSKVKAAEWKKMAEAYIAADPETFRKQAEANLAAAKGFTTSAKVDFTVHEDPELARKADAANAKKRKTKEAKPSAPPPKTKAKGKGAPAHA